jgi:Family of unknown function (DUF6464)
MGIVIVLVLWLVWCTMSVALGIRAKRRATRRAHQRYLQGLMAPAASGPAWGGVLGDPSCRFNARSAYLRCAVNPSGDCKDCRYYESVSEAVGPSQGTNS